MTKRFSPYKYDLFIALAAMSGCFLYLLNRTWMKWGDLLVDTFREFWVPMKLLEGHALYRDIFFEYGFFPPYLQALLLKLFGLHLNTLVGLGIVVTILVAIALYLVCRLFLDTFVAALTVIVFFSVFAFNHYFYNNTFNFILPYSFASTLFLMFTLYAVYFFLRFIQSGRHRHLFCWALCLSMAFFCRVELPLLIWTGFFATGVIYAVKTRKKNDIRLWLLLLLPVIAGIAGYCLFASVFHAWGGLRECIIDHILYFKKGPFQEMIMGTDDTAASLKTIGKSTLLTLALFPLIGVCAAGITKYRRSPSSAPLILLLCSLGLLLVFAFAPAHFVRIQYRCLSLLLPAGLLYYCYRLFGEENIIYPLQMTCLFMLSTLMSSRMLLYIEPELYGFYLLVSGLICYHLIVFKIISPLVVRAIPGSSKRLIEFVYICFLLFLAFGYWTQSDQRYERRTMKIVTDKGTFNCFNDDYNQMACLAVDYLRQSTLPEASVVVFPEGIGINFFADRKNPLPYYNFMPSVLQFIGDDKLIKALEDNDVDFVLVVGRTAFDYGYPFFGVHYAQKLFGWIQKNYRLEKIIGAMPFATERFGVAVYRKI